jgi:hypothetical protein
MGSGSRHGKAFPLPIRCARQTTQEAREAVGRFVRRRFLEHLQGQGALGFPG